MPNTASLSDTTRSASNRRTLFLAMGLVVLVTLIVWPSLMGRIQYAKTRAELAAIRDAASGSELSAVGKLFTTLARVVGPTVVNVTAKRRVHRIADEIASLHEDSPQNITQESVGSGVIVRKDGVIVTNYHVVSQVDVIDVQLADGRHLIAELIGADAATDLAVIKITATDLPTAVWGDSDSLEPGEMVWAIGNPYGLDRTITYGIISAIGRRGVLENPFQEFLQTDASINPGNSGGPLVDVHGRIMGITTAIVGRDFRGIGFAIPSNTARKVSEDIQSTGHVERGYIGMSLRALPPVVSNLHGVGVIAVEPHSPAAFAGIKAGDIVVGYAGEQIVEPSSFVLLLTRSPVGSEVVMEIVRGEDRLKVRVRIGRRPQEE